MAMKWTGAEVVAVFAAGCSTRAECEAALALASRRGNIGEDAYLRGMEAVAKRFGGEG